MTAPPPSFREAWFTLRLRATDAGAIAWSLPRIRRTSTDCTVSARFQARSGRSWTQELRIR